MSPEFDVPPVTAHVPGAVRYGSDKGGSWAEITVCDPLTGMPQREKHYLPTRTKDGVPDPLTSRARRYLASWHPGTPLYRLNNVHGINVALPHARIALVHDWVRRIQAERWIDPLVGRRYTRSEFINEAIDVYLLWLERNGLAHPPPGAVDLSIATLVKRRAPRVKPLSRLEQRWKRLVALAERDGDDVPTLEEYRAQCRARTRTIRRVSRQSA